MLMICLTDHNDMYIVKQTSIYGQLIYGDNTFASLNNYYFEALICTIIYLYNLCKPRHISRLKLLLRYYIKISQELLKNKNYECLL